MTPPPASIASRDAQTPHRLHSPDVLRGFAACGVVLFHVYYLSGIPTGGAFGFVVARFDFFVRLFFGLSAFAMCYAYSGRLKRIEDIRQFYLKRFCRIAPLFYCVAAVSGLQGYLATHQIASAFDWVLSLSFLYALVPGKIDSVVGGGWSIGIEWLFYFVFPMLYALVRSVRTAFCLWLLLCTVSVLSRQYFQTLEDPHALHIFGLLYALAHLHYFAIGFLTYHLYAAVLKPALARQAPHMRMRTALLADAAFVATLAATILYFQRFGTRIGEEQFLSGAIFILLIAASVGFSRIFDNALTRLLGQISYSLYLTQFPVLSLLSKYGVYRAINDATTSNQLAFVGASLVTLPAVILVSLLTYRCIEQPGTRLWQKWARRRTAITMPPLPPQAQTQRL